MRTFKIRCSKIGIIMSGSIRLSIAQESNYQKLLTKEKLTDTQQATFDSLKNKRENPQLPTGVKTYIKDWLKTRPEFYNRSKSFSNKYTKKGNQNEDQSIELVSRYLDLGMIFKNEKHFSNKFMTGTPDIILSNPVIDVKNSWDEHTFPLFEEEIPESDYYWQAQGYMALTGKENYKLIYTLTDTPIKLIQKEAYWFCINNDIEYDSEVFESFRERMTFSNLPDKLRIKIFDIKRNDEDIKLIKQRVELCRGYIKELIGSFNKKL